jgi:hypothetical protein
MKSVPLGSQNTVEFTASLPFSQLPPLSSQQDKSPHLVTNEHLFRRLFEEVTWPLFCQMVLQQARGVCLTGYQDLHLQAADKQRSFDVAVTEQSRKVVCTSLALLAALLGMPVLGGEQATRKDLQLKAKAREHVQVQEPSFWSALPTPFAPSTDKEEEAMAVCSQFVAACNAYTPLPPDALNALQAPLYSWLLRRQRAFLRQTIHLPTPSDQEAGRNRQSAMRIVPPESRAGERLRARQHKLRIIRGTVYSPEKRGTVSTHARPHLSGSQFATIHS